MQRYNQYDQEGYVVESDNKPRYHNQNIRVDRRDRERAGALRPVYSPWQSFTRGLVTVGIIGAVVVLALGVYAVRSMLPFIGVLAILSAIILIICGVAWVVVTVIRHATRADFYPVEENGAYLRNALGRVQPLAPMIAAPARVNRATAKVEITPVVPTLFDLIESGEIVPGVLTMVMGYDSAQLKKGILQLVLGTWPGTHAVAGKGRSGKSRRVIGTIAQALISGARVIVCDPHFTKPDGLANTLAPLEKYLTIARGETAILAATREFMREMYTRQETPGYEMRPWLIVFDEWSKLMNKNNEKIDDDGRELLKEAALRCSTEFAGYLGYCCLIGHVWTQEACGGTDVRRSLQAIFCHQLSAEYAQFFFRPAKWRNRAEELKLRECLYKDNDGQICELVTIGVPDDTASRVAVYLASIGMQAIDAPASAAPLPDYREPGRLREQSGALAYQMLPAPAPVSPAQDIQPDYTYSRLPGFSGSPDFTNLSNGNVVNADVELCEEMEPLAPRSETPSMQGESFTAQGKAVEYTREQETAILKAAFQLARESDGRLTRSDIKERLGWNNKQYPIIKAVCDRHEIAKQ